MLEDYWTDPQGPMCSVRHTSVRVCAVLCCSGSDVGGAHLVAYSFDGPWTNDDDEKKIGMWGAMWVLDQRKNWGDPACSQAIRMWVIAILVALISTY
jgi:hypothetical protein